MGREKRMLAGSFSSPSAVTSQIRCFSHIRIGKSPSFFKGRAALTIAVESSGGGPFINQTPSQSESILRR